MLGIDERRYITDAAQLSVSVRRVRFDFEIIREFAYLVIMQVIYTGVDILSVTQNPDLDLSTLI